MDAIAFLASVAAVVTMLLVAYRLGKRAGASKPAATPAPAAAPANGQASDWPCPFCGRLNRHEAGFCSNCGQRNRGRTPVQRLCRHCGRSVRRGAKFCPFDGKPLE